MNFFERVIVMNFEDSVYKVHFQGVVYSFRVSASYTMVRMV